MLTQLIGGQRLALPFSLTNRQNRLQSANRLSVAALSLGLFFGRGNCPATDFIGRLWHGLWQNAAKLEVRNGVAGVDYPGM